jgi:hypothetical protein
MLPSEKESNEYPTRRVLDLKGNGMENRDIASLLKRENFGKQEISGAMDQAAVKNEISPLPTAAALNPDDVPAPSQTPEPQQEEMPRQQPQQETMQPSTPTFAPEPAGRANYEMMEEMAESIVSEKWEDMVRNVGDLRLWKEKVETDLAGIKQEVLRTQSRFENLQKAVLGKVSEYSQGITDLNSEIKAMEKVFEKILGPLTKNVKDLEKVTQKLKK